MVKKSKSRPSDEPRPATKAKSKGEALDDIGFAPLDPPKRIIIREDYTQEPLTRWRKSRKQG